jgi:hypothetical protein
MTELATRTPAQVQQSMTNPSGRGVTTRRRRVGHSTSHTRMAPWRNRGVSWEDLNAAEDSLHAAELKKLEQLTTTELLRESARAIMIAHIKLSLAVQKLIDAGPTTTEAEKLAVVILQQVRSYEVMVEAWKTYLDLVRLEGNAPVE